MTTSIPSTVRGIFLSFNGCFTAPSFVTFVALVTGWILCQGRHSISRVIQAAGEEAGGKHHSTLYRFFSRAKWSPDQLGEVLFLLLLPFLKETVLGVVDDTLCRRGGPRLWGAGIHHDACRSTYGRLTSAGRKVAFAFGLNWVVLAVWVPLPWKNNGGLAVPVLFRLYRSKKLCPQSEYSKRTKLATELVHLLSEWVPEGSKLYVVGDGEYSCKTVVSDLPKGAGFVGTMNMNAALYEQPAKRSGRGRPRVKGPRLPSPKKLAESEAQEWQPRTLAIYGQEVTLLTKTMVCLWYSVAGKELVRMVVTRDPRGNLGDRAYFSTDLSLSVEQILAVYACRWSVEASFRNAKQALGITEPQNGWGRRKHGTEKPKKRPGPRPLGNRGRAASERTLPFAFMAYGVVVVWYLRHGQPEEDVSRAKEKAPWYRHKQAPSFFDMLAALRREIWALRFFRHPLLKQAGAKISELRELLPGWVLRAA